MTLNGLTAACNQKSNRFPVTEYSDRDIQEGLAGLRSHGYAAEITGGGRVSKYAQRFTEKLNLGRRETAVLCVLMLRGQQTLGEIKGRTDRLYGFADLDEVEMVLRKLMERPEGAFVQKLAPSPGMKEPRFAQTLGGPVDPAALQQPSSGPPGTAERLLNLENEVAELRAELAQLKQRLDEVL